MVGIKRATETHIKSTLILVMGSLRPMFKANYKDVAFRSTKPPTIIPVDWQPAWIMLISFGSPSYFKHKASRAISWRLRAKYMKNPIIAKFLAWFKSVKNEQRNTVKIVANWLTTIHVFLFPYVILEYFSKSGAVTNLNENGNAESENKLSVK